MTLNIIVDTNVFALASFDKKKKSADVRLVNDLYRGLLNLCYSPFMENELEDIMNKCHPSFTFSRKVFTIFQQGTKITSLTPLNICSDPSDNVFLECAITSRTPYIITHDKELLKHHSYSNINILTPSCFYQKNSHWPKTKFYHPLIHY